MGESESITATVAPETASDKAVEYTSSDETVATVDASGLVMAVGNGECIITATSKDAYAQGEAMTAQTSVTVTTRPESIKMSQSEGVVTRGQGHQLSVIVGPETVNVDYVVVWGSSDESVATVSEDGYISALAAGTATITASIEGTDLTAEFALTVRNPAPVAPTTPSGGTGGAGTPAPSGGGDSGYTPPPSPGGDVAAAIAAGQAKAVEMGAILGPGGGSHNAPTSTAISTEAMIASVVADVTFQVSRGGAGCYINIYESGGYIYVCMY